MVGSATQASENNDNTNIDWSMQNPYANTAMEKNYWDPNSQENDYVTRLFSDIAMKYGGRGAEVNQQLTDAGVAPGSGTIGSFAHAQQIEKPRAQEESNILNNQYNQRWAGEQGQFTRQGDYTTQLNDLAYKKAAGEQSARFDARENVLNRRSESALNSQNNMTKLAGAAIGSAFPVAAAGSAAYQAWLESQKSGQGPQIE